jgi:signal transduction histidine kinase
MYGENPGPASYPAPRERLASTLETVRDRLIARWADRVRKELAVTPLPIVELTDHMPSFVDELIERARDPSLRAAVESAEQHGGQRFRLGFDVDEVVREYGLLYECILDAVTETGYALELEDHRLIASALSEGVKDAVAQYIKQRDAELERQASEHMGFIAHEVRNGISAALLTYQRMRQQVGAGASMDRLGRNLRNVASVIDNALTHAWLRMGVVLALQEIRIRALLEELGLDMEAEAQGRRVELQMDLPPDLAVTADPRLLRSAVSNLLTNALKFSPAGSTVTLHGWVAAGRLRIDVTDQCGGLPAGKAEELFSPLVQRHGNRSGFGLGLAIVLQAVQAHGGTVKVRDVPHVGCVFSLDLPVLQHHEARAEEHGASPPGA